VSHAKRPNRCVVDSGSGSKESDTVLDWVEIPHHENGKCLWNTFWPTMDGVDIGLAGASLDLHAKVTLRVSV